MEDDDHVDLSNEQMDELLRAHENVFNLKEKIANALNGQPSNDCFLAMRMMVVQFLCDTCVSKEAAIDLLGSMMASSITILNSMDEMGACAWNYNDQTLQ